MYAPPYALRVTSVTRGTLASANACSSFAPRRITPPHSCATPGRYPGTSATTSSGRPYASHIRTKRDPFSALSESRQPPLRSGLLATTPTARPANRPRPQSRFGAQFGWISTTPALSSRRARMSGRTS